MYKTKEPSLIPTIIGIIIVVLIVLGFGATTYDTHRGSSQYNHGR